MTVKGADPGRRGEFGELDGARFGDHVRAAGAVCGEGADVAFGIGLFHGAKAGGSSARGRAAHGMEAEERDGACDEFAVEGGGDEDGDVVVAEAVRADEQCAMPEGEDRWAGDFDADGCTGRSDVAITQRGAERADEERGEWWDDGEQESLLAREDMHEDEFSCLRQCC